MRNSRFFLLLCLIWVASARAESAVDVYWNVNFVTGNGTKISHRSPPEYLNLLRACGHSPELVKLDALPLSVLKCKGLLDFSASKSLIAGLRARLAATQAKGILEVGGLKVKLVSQRLDELSFAISHYGIFQSSADGIGNARRMGLNISQLRLVILNLPFWTQIAESQERDLFLLHEALEALGYGDFQYDLSLAMLGLGDAAGVGPVVVAMNNKEERDRGGISAVGHGGNFTQLMMKASLFKAAEDQPLKFTDVKPKDLPTKAELKKVISDTPITMVSETFFYGKTDLCRDPDTNEVEEFLCGGFVFKGVDGKPFLLMPEGLGSFSEAEQVRFVNKIFRQITLELIRAKQQN